MRRDDYLRGMSPLNIIIALTNMIKSDSKQASKQPYDEKEQLELIISALNTGLALINPDMTLVWTNDIIKKLFPDTESYPAKHVLPRLKTGRRPARAARRFWPLKMVKFMNGNSRTNDEQALV